MSRIQVILCDWGCLHICVDHDGDDDSSFYDDGSVGGDDNDGDDVDDGGDDDGDDNYGDEYDDDDGYRCPLSRKLQRQWNWLSSNRRCH